MENSVSKITLSSVGTPQINGNNGLPKSANISMDTYCPNLKKDVYKTNGQNKYSGNTAKTANVNQFNPKLLLKVLANYDYINSAVNENPELKAILDKYNLKEINKKNILEVADSHLTTTTMYALMIANKMGLSAGEKKILEQACIFHDFGKMLIPSQILNKPGKLTQDEKEIMDLHSELGYQALLNSGLSNRVLNLVRNHHKNVTENNDLLGQILSVADIYSALREKRAYKQPMSVDTAFEILDQKAEKGEVSAEVVNILKSTQIFPLKKWGA